MGKRPLFIDGALGIIAAEPEFSAELKLLQNCKYKRKPFFFPYAKEFSTTIRNTIWYARNWPVDPLPLAATLVHEAVHLDQWTRPYSMITRYSQPAGRLALEQEAFVKTFHWWIKKGLIPHPAISTDPKSLYEGNPYVGGEMRVFYHNYMIKSVITWDELMEWATAQVVLLWS